jgi:hypothetical protein
MGAPKSECDPAPRGTLQIETLRLLRDRPRHMTYEKITELMDNSKCRPISVHWIHSYLSGKLTRPDVDRVQALYEILTGRSLSFD